jgi:hypothetical protein
MKKTNNLSNTAPILKSKDTHASVVLSKTKVPATPSKATSPTKGETKKTTTKIVPSRYLAPKKDTTHTNGDKSTLNTTQKLSVPKKTITTHAKALPTASTVNSTTLKATKRTTSTRPNTTTTTSSSTSSLPKRPQSSPLKRPLKSKTNTGLPSSKDAVIDELNVKILQLHRSLGLVIDERDQLKQRLILAEEKVRDNTVSCQSQDKDVTSDGDHDNNDNATSNNDNNDNNNNSNNIGDGLSENTIDGLDIINANTTDVQSDEDADADADVDVDVDVGVDVDVDLDSDERDERYGELALRYRTTLSVLKQKIGLFKQALFDAKNEYDQLMVLYQDALKEVEQLRNSGTHTPTTAQSLPVTIS